MKEPDTECLRVIIAGKKIEIECRHRDIIRTCRDYIADFETPDMFIPLITREELNRERESAIATDIAEGREPQRHSDAALETVSVNRKLSEALLSEGFLLFHGAAIAAEGKCYLFMARSGTGKTTHIRKWLKLHPDTFVVNGDKPLIDINTRMVYGTPWCGKESLGTNTAVPLGGLIQLERGTENKIERISFSEMLGCLFHQCHFPPDSKLQVIQLLARLQSVPSWKLHCNMDDSAGEVSYNALVVLSP